MRGKDKLQEEPKAFFLKKKLAIAQVSRLKVFTVYKLGTGSHPGLIKWIQVTGDMLNLTRLPKCEQIHSAVFPEHISLLEFSLYAIFSRNHMLHFQRVEKSSLDFHECDFCSYRHLHTHKPRHACELPGTSRTICRRVERIQTFFPHVYAAMTGARKQVVGGGEKKI